MTTQATTPHRTIALAFVAFVLAANGAHADDAGSGVPPLFLFSGFGTVGIVHSSEKRADFRSIGYKPDGAGYSHGWSPDVDTLIGAQVTANFSPRLSAIVQVVSEQNYDSTYRPHVEWANLKYQFTPDFSVRVGRIALPLFTESDTRKIGYAHPWVRPPVEVYSQVPVTSNDGIDASWRVPLGAASNTFQLAAGQSDTRFPTTTLKARQLAAIVYTFEQGPATMRVNYGRARLTIPEFGTLADSFRQFGPQGVAIADKYDVNRRLVQFFGVGASYDPGAWFVKGEWTAILTDSALGRRSAWNIGGGYRLGMFTPFAAYSSATADSLSDPGLAVNALPPSLAVPATSLNAVLNTLLSTKVVQNTISIGARWDLMRNASLTLQYDHTRIGAGSTGTLANRQPGFPSGGALNVFSAAIDFVF